MTGKSAFSNRGANSTEPGRLGSKTRISAWQALVWAYQRECVRMIMSLRDRVPGFGASSMVSIENALNNCSPGGTMHEPPLPPQDATDIDDFVKRRMKGDYAQYMIIATAAERGIPISPTIEKPPLRPRPKEEPRWKSFLGNRSLIAPYFIHPINRRPFFTPIIYVGYSDEDLRRLQDLQARKHQLLVALLDVMDGMELERWTISGRGLTSCDESLTQVAM